MATQNTSAPFPIYGVLLIIAGILGMVKGSQGVGLPPFMLLPEFSPGMVVISSIVLIGYGIFKIGVYAQSNKA